MAQKNKLDKNKVVDGIKPYLADDIWYELWTRDGILYRGHRIVIPINLQDKVINICHEGHQGIVKSKKLLRSYCWFPGIDQKVEQLIKSCRICQSIQCNNNKEPVIMSELPSGPWQKCSMDYQGPYPNGENIFVVTDYYSRWPEVRFTRTPPTAKITIKFLKEIFADKGVPYEIKSDNWFKNRELIDFGKEMGFKLAPVTPEWPRANGAVERFNRTLK